MGAVNSPLVHWKAGQRPMGAGAGLHLQWKAGRIPGGGSILRRRLQRGNRWGTPKGYALVQSFFRHRICGVNDDGGGPHFQVTRRVERQLVQLQSLIRSLITMV